MLFNSLHFMLFFPTVALLYFRLAHRYRWMFLLAASYYFYMAWNPGYLILIILSTLIDYISGIRISATADKSLRRFYLICSLVSNFGLLFFFKYFNFFNDTFRVIFTYFGLKYNLEGSNFLLPIGISFYTFQTLSYTIDVYRDKMQPEKHLGRFALFVAFFPQLVAGPIERATNLIPQFRNRVSFDYQRVVAGCQIMTWGLFKKIVIADRLAILVNRVYNDPHGYDGPGIAIATILFAYQIYCDFSGYSDIAVGAAQVLGFDLMENFRRPYHSKSIGEFWRRWHISLSTWFRDYLYIPLGGNRVSSMRLYFNLMTVFVISGLWHGANWTFLIWGALHGSYLVVSILTDGWRGKLAKVVGLQRMPVMQNALKIIVTFLLVNFAWIFFCANSISDALFMTGQLGTGWKELLSGQMTVAYFCLGLPSTFLIGVLSILFLETIQCLERKKDIRNMLTGKPVWFRWAVYYSVIVVIILGGVYDQTPFIYFQF